MYKDNFKAKYYGTRNGVSQFKDNYREGIDLLPTESNENNSSFKVECGLNGFTGEFMRLLYGATTAPVEDENLMYASMKKYFDDSTEFGLVSPAQKNLLLQIAYELLFCRSKMSILDASFFTLLPLTGKKVECEKKKKYEDSQKKLANFLHDMLDDNYQPPTSSSGNLLSSILKKALSYNSEPWTKDFSRTYTVHPVVKKQFQDDLKWFMENHSDINTVQYLPLLLYFYVCHGIIQMVQALDVLEENVLTENKIRPLFYLVEGDTASAAKPAVEKGWHRIVKNELPKMLGKLQTLDILNSLLEKTPDTVSAIGFYPEILKELEKTPWNNDIKKDCEEILNNYQRDKKAMLENRKDANRDLANRYENKEFDLLGYSDFIKQLYRVCCSLNTLDYISRFSNKINDILKLRLQQVRRGYYVLVLDEEMLLFLFSLATKERKTLLKDAYKKLESYGIQFSHETRIRVESLLLKMNLLDRKSDAGEAQYVTVVL